MTEVTHVLLYGHALVVRGAFESDVSRSEGGGGGGGGGGGDGGVFVMSVCGV